MFKDGVFYSPFDIKFSFPEEKSFVEFALKQIARHHQNGLAELKWITDAETGEYCTMSQVEPMSRKVASGLYKRGVRLGDVILYCAVDPSKVFVFMFGVWRANGILRACYSDETSDVIAARILESKVKWIACSPESLHEIKTALKIVPWEVEVIVFGESEGCTPISDIFEDNGDACPEFQAEADDTALILHTSGTTGPPKGALYTHAGLAIAVAGIQQIMYEEYDSTLLDLVLGRTTHAGGVALAFAALIGARRIAMLRTFTKENILRAVHDYKPTAVFGYPKYLLNLVEKEDCDEKYDLSSIRYVYANGCVITPTFTKAMEVIPGLRVIADYGMTENWYFAYTKNFDYALQGTDRMLADVPEFSTGKLVPGTVLQVRDLESGKPLGPNESGELCFKNPATCQGYLNVLEDGKKYFTDGWIRTGDVGYVDDNEFIFVTDRVKQMFKYYYNHISPNEIESVILRHPAVAEACVVGIPDPEGRGMVPRAFIRLNDPRLESHTIKEFANGKLAPYKQLRGGVIVVDKIPTVNTGKYNRKSLMEMLVPAKNN